MGWSAAEDATAACNRHPALPALAPAARACSAAGAPRRHGSLWAGGREGLSPLSPSGFVHASSRWPCGNRWQPILERTLPASRMLPCPVQRCRAWAAKPKISSSGGPRARARSGHLEPPASFGAAHAGTKGVLEPAPATCLAPNTCVCSSCTHNFTATPTHPQPLRSTVATCCLPASPVL